MGEIQPVFVVPAQRGREGNGYYNRIPMQFVAVPGGGFNPPVAFSGSVITPIFDCNYEKDSKSAQAANSYRIPYAPFYWLTFTVLNWSALYIASRKNMLLSLAMQGGNDVNDLWILYQALGSPSGNLQNYVPYSLIPGSISDSYFNRQLKITQPPRFFQVNFMLGAEINTIPADVVINLELGKY